MAKGRFYKLHAQSMRFGTTPGLVPIDILPIDSHKTAFYCLGANDAAFWGQDGFAEMWATSFMQDMGILQRANWRGERFNIFLVLPPLVDLPDRNTKGVRDWLRLWHAVAVLRYKIKNIRLVDMDDYNVLEGSRDGLHIAEPAALIFGDAMHQLKEAWKLEVPPEEPFE
jgi:hypothetical protein